jgi:hypothetical protein
VPVGDSWSTIVGGTGNTTFIVKGSDLEADVGALSVTMTVNVEVPVLVGVPLTDPSFPSVRPGGRLPVVMLHCSGRYPPETLKLYGP